MIGLLGWISAWCLALCGLPLCIHILRTKKVDGVSVLFAWLWVVGEITGLIYVLHEAPRFPLIANFVVNLGLSAFLVVLLMIYGEGK